MKTEDGETLKDRNGKPWGPGPIERAVEREVSMTEAKVGRENLRQEYDYEGWGDDDA